ncbi:GDSL-type esterase/lipase family protein [Paenibacillus pini]|uniref:Lipolytic enzyme n=1 Tax=Paenibacillus pini JCM 16418 TaxID=1236976 RepID=W7YWH9_9BACL|nr:GDSL-type esterase/lipase family protein [Paenibacillus pini]GAF06689.1 lipolytic enzyme [Paenibacillus pini JCM 16418]
MVYPYTAIGDSLTVGFGAMPGNGFAPVYRGMVERHVKSFVAYENLGINGLTSSRLYEHVSSNPMVRQSLQQAQIITISIGGNDLIRAARTAPGTNLYPHFNKALSECKNNFAGIMKNIYQLKARTNQPYIIRAIGLYNPYPQVEEATYWVQQYNQYLDGFYSNNFATAQIFSAFAGRERALLSIDHIHPNGKGYRVIADQLNRLGYRPLS